MRVPYYIGDLKGTLNLENYPYLRTHVYIHTRMFGCVSWQSSSRFWVGGKPNTVHPFGTVKEVLKATSRSVRKISSRFILLIIILYFMMPHDPIVSVPCMQGQGVGMHAIRKEDSYIRHLKFFAPDIRSSKSLAFDAGPPPKERPRPRAF